MTDYSKSRDALARRNPKAAVTGLMTDDPSAKLRQLPVKDTHHRPVKAAPKTTSLSGRQLDKVAARIASATSEAERKKLYQEAVVQRRAKHAGAAHSVQARRLRLHLSRLVQQRARVETDGQRKAIDALIQRDIDKLKDIQLMYLAALQSGQKHGWNELTPVRKEPMSPLPRGSVPRGWNT